MPTLGAYFPDDSPLILQIEDRAKRFHDGRTSSYIKAAILRDLESEGGALERMPSPVDPFVMEKLARVLLGHMRAGRMSAVMEGRDQVAELTNLLELHLLECERERNKLVAEEAASYGASLKTGAPAARGRRT